MTAPTLDDALAETGGERAVRVQVDFYVDPTWSRDRLACHLLDTAALTYRRLAAELLEAGA